MSILLRDFLLAHHINGAPSGDINVQKAILFVLLTKLREGSIVASAQQGPFDDRRDIPSEYWESVEGHDFDWFHSRVPAHGMQSVKLRLRDPETGIRYGGEFRNQIRYFTGEVTYVDVEYDEDTGSALRTPVRPPLFAQKGALKSDIEYFAGGITYVDVEYDEGTGECCPHQNAASR